MVTIALGKDSGSFFLTRFDGTADVDTDQLLGLRGGFDESLGLPLATPSTLGRRHGIRHVIGAVTVALVVASAGFVLGAGIADRENGDLRSEREIAQVAAPIDVQGPDASPVAEVMDDHFDHEESVATSRGSDSTRSPEAEVAGADLVADQIAPLVAPSPDTALPALAEPIVDADQGGLSSVINEALEETETSEALAPQAPRSLTRQQVITGMREVTELVMNCTMADRVVVNVTIDGVSGEVTSARLIGPMDGTAEGACVERSIRRARFPRFSDERLNVRYYPFTLRAAL